MNDSKSGSQDNLVNTLTDWVRIKKTAQDVVDNIAALSSTIYVTKDMICGDLSKDKTDDNAAMVETDGFLDTVDAQLKVTLDIIQYMKHNIECINDGHSKARKVGKMNGK